VSYVLEALNFIAMPLVFAVISAVLFALVLGKAGFARWPALLAFVPVALQIGIYFAGGWIAFYEVMGPLPLAVPLFQLVMFAIGFVPLFILAFVRWPAQGVR